MCSHQILHLTALQPKRRVSQQCQKPIQQPVLIRTALHFSPNRDLFSGLGPENSQIAGKSLMSLAYVSMWENTQDRVQW